MLRYTIAILIVFSSGPVFSQKTQPIHTIEAHSSSLLALEFSPNGKLLASVGDDGKMKVWDVASTKEVFNVKDVRQNSNRVRFTPNGEFVLTMNSNREILIVANATGNASKTIKLPELSGGPQSFDLSPDGKTIAIVGRSTLCTVNFADGKRISTFDAHKGYAVNAVAWSLDGKFLATTGSDRTALVANAQDGKVIKKWPIHLAGLALAFSSEGKTLFVASDDKKLRACQFESDEPTVVIDKSVPLMSLSMSHDGSKLVVGGPGRAPWIMTTSNRQLVDQTLDADDWVKCGAISPDGQWIAGGANNGSIYLWKAP
jgi:WD40 repeat protein